ncbi:homoserine dehydrogenase ASCRUDRAFT_67946 [Ascoidea rubescens DSM 1968]|uniref:Homoserine dehydrogenase n=1 Tax=Ascoidea rubescens DSM 1968 TaxID=1344418 RepID=A0A1D2VQL4_9ASCO|nr:hypothetical protein ASCRUDRAFT_67946 [Ascoidea rubescens DSM 1968]ODV63889.1 hypothetical protein ASCRUDRAFT_67946 [Ascoidea rubescens DSM 1968]
MVKSVNVAIVGTGVVGSAFVSQLLRMSSSIKYNVIYIGNADQSLKAPTGLSADNWASALQSSKTPSLSIPDLLEFLKEQSSITKLPTILVDNTSSLAIAQSYPKFLENKISIATPNKKAFSDNYSLWEQLFNESRKKNDTALLYHEATVGAGLPIIGTLNDLIQTGDKIIKIEGIFSGSLSFIFNSFSQSDDIKFSDIVLKAKELGYTEPDPRDDLGGLDVARKVIILARISGFGINSLNDLDIESLIPKELSSPTLSTADFLSQLPNFDDQIKQQKIDAANEGKVLRFVGSVDLVNNKVFVGIAKYDKSHPFASLQGSDNVISIQTERYTNPLIVQGAGAGSEVTAAGVLADTIKIAQRVAV